MTETAKTCVFIGVGLLTAVLAFAASREPAPLDLTDEKTFTRIENAADVASMKIVKYNDTTGQVDQFMVEDEGGHYVIPSHFGYPADAQQQLLDAAGTVMQIDILKIEDNDRSLHDEHGLIDPLDPAVGQDTDAETVGMRVTMTNGEGKAIADFIIGNTASENSMPMPGGAGKEVHFVRRAGQDRIYTVEIDTSKLSTNFEDWIEKDLLKLDPLDVRGVTLQDYSIQYKRGLLGIQQAAGIDERASVRLAYDPQDLKWKLQSLISFDQVQGRPVRMRLADDQELDATKLNGLKNALDDLKIVDVRRKPGVVNEEKIEESDEAALQDLVSKGFFFNPSARQIVSDQGEVQIDMANGVQYVLRFGRIAGSEEKTAEGEAANTAGQEIHRYLWVVAKENLGIFPPPALMPVPEMPKAPVEVEKVEPGEGEEGEGEEGPSLEDRKKEYEKLKAARTKVLRDNERKKSEYQSKLDGAKEAVAKLNRRFNDWYYVIADDTYKQIHLGRDDIIKMKEVDPAAAGGAGAPPAAGGSWLQKGLNFGKDKLKGMLPKGAEKPANVDGPDAAQPVKPETAPPVESEAESPVSEEPAAETTDSEAADGEAESTDLPAAGDAVEAAEETTAEETPAEQPAEESQPADGGQEEAQPKENESAILQLHKAVEANREDAGAYFNLAAAYHGLSRTHPKNDYYWKQAEIHYHKCLDVTEERHEEHVECYRSLAKLLIERGQQENALTLLRGWSQETASEAAKSELARLQEQLGKSEG